MKVALVTDGLTPFVVGGMQKHSYNLCKHLLSLNIEVLLLHCTPHSDPPVSRETLLTALELPDTNNLQVFCRSFPKHLPLPGHYLRESMQYSRWCYNQIKDQLDSIDWIYTKGFAGWYFAKRKSQGHSLPILSTKFHGYEMFQPPADFRRSLEAKLLRKPVQFIHKHADFVFSYGGKITEIVADKLKVQAFKIIDIPTGIDPSWIKEKAPQKDTKRPKFAFVGRNERRKGIEELNEVLADLDTSLEFSFDFIGPIPQSAQLPDPRITYHGEIRDSVRLREILDSCDVLVTPSHAEGMPNVIMEAMARSLAIIATDTGAVRMMVGPSNGWLITPGSVIELDQAIRDCVSTPLNELSIKGKASLELCKNKFLWSKIASQHIEAMTSKQVPS